MTRELPTLPFATLALWETWLSEQHDQLQGIWIKMAKQATGISSVTHDEALEVALCYGWIDGQRNGFDDTYFLQKFTPRRSKSLWSKRNIEKVSKLVGSSRMQPSGMTEVEAAKLDGRWDAAYDSSRDMVVPDDFLKALEENKQAKTFFQSLNKSKVYALAWRLQTAKKPETRQRRFAALLAMLTRDEFR